MFTAVATGLNDGIWCRVGDREVMGYLVLGLFPIRVWGAALRRRCESIIFIIGPWVLGNAVDRLQF